MKETFPQISADE